MTDTEKPWVIVARQYEKGQRVNLGAPFYGPDYAGYVHRLNGAGLYSEADAKAEVERVPGCKMKAYPVDSPELRDYLAHWHPLRAAEFDLFNAARAASPILVDQDAGPGKPEALLSQEWATRCGFNMEQELTHGYFISTHTQAARKGWRAAASIPVAGVTAPELVALLKQHEGMPALPCYVRPAGDHEGWCLVGESDRGQDDANYHAMDFATFADESLARLAAAALNALPHLLAAPAAAPVVIQAGGAGEWISVDERLPEPTIWEGTSPSTMAVKMRRTEYWPVSIWREGQERAEVAIYETHSGRWLDLQTEKALEYVTHWQPLPAAPAGI